MARSNEPVEQWRAEIGQRPGGRGAPQDSAKGTVSVEDLTIATLPLLIGLVLLLFGFGPGVVTLGA